MCVCVCVCVRVCVCLRVYVHIYCIQVAAYTVPDLAVDGVARDKDEEEEGGVGGVQEAVKTLRSLGVLKPKLNPKLNTRQKMTELLQRRGGVAKGLWGSGNGGKGGVAREQVLFV